MEGGNSPVFGSSKYFFKNQRGVSYELAKTEISYILLKDTVAEIEFGPHWAERTNGGRMLSLEGSKSLQGSARRTLYSG